MALSYFVGEIRSGIATVSNALSASVRFGTAFRSGSGEIRVVATPSDQVSLFLRNVTYDGFEVTSSAELTGQINWLARPHGRQ